MTLIIRHPVVRMKKYAHLSVSNILFEADMYKIQLQQWSVPGFVE